MKFNLLMVPMKHSQLTLLERTYLYTLMKNNTGSSYLMRSSTREESMMQYTRVTHSLRPALKIGDES